MRELRKRQKGAVFVEFALAFLIFILLSLGLFEMARGMWAFTTLSHAVRQGARYAIVRGANSSTPASDTAIENVVKNQAIGLVKNDITVTVIWEDPASKDGGEYVQVRATYPFTSVTGSAIISKDFSLGAVSRMTIAY